MQGPDVRDQAQVALATTGLTAAGFQTALLGLIDGWLTPAPTDVMICGLSEVLRDGPPFASVPLALNAAILHHMSGLDPRIRAISVPGLQQTSPPDLMSGDETRIAGFLSTRPNWDGVICLPGRHSRWVQISGSEVISFRTAMTGEMFDALSKHSILAQTLSSGWDEAAFAEAVDDALSKPEQLAARLYGLHAADRLNGTAPGAARARLSGLLIGAELAATRPYWLGQQIAVIGSDEVSAPYLSALRQQGAFVEAADKTKTTLAGLWFLRQQTYADA